MNQRPVMRKCLLLFALLLVTSSHAFGDLGAGLIESDEGSMPVERHNLKQTSILKKCLAYETARKQGLHQRQFDWKHFRVPIVTNTTARAANIRAMIMRTPVLKSSPLFLITDKPSLESAPDILEHHWLDAAGNRHTLI
jgi:hypothetical protein